MTPEDRASVTPERNAQMRTNLRSQGDGPDDRGEFRVGYVLALLDRVDELELELVLAKDVGRGGEG